MCRRALEVHIVVQGFPTSNITYSFQQGWAFGSLANSEVLLHKMAFSAYKNIQSGQGFSYKCEPTDSER